MILSTSSYSFSVQTLSGSPVSAPPPPPYRGRFAPSPSGPLHFGSLVTAVGSYLDAKLHHGEWLVRIENVDHAREIPGATGAILSMLEALGMEWNREVILQSQRYPAYADAVSRLVAQGLIYPCNCSRKEIADSSINGVDGAVYPGNCRERIFTSRQGESWRVRTDNCLIEFRDMLQSSVRQRLTRDIGDFVIRRADGAFSYQLAVVVDDAQQGITHVVRGADLLNSTPRQIYLQRLLGYSTPSYTHLPIAVNALGQKLSKQTGAAPIDAAYPVPQLVRALRFLGQKPPLELNQGDRTSFWTWAIDNWDQGAIRQNGMMAVFRS